ncbi:MAG: CPBP family intramembrane metalloprotease [Phycisphaerales bacterium]|jgi:hypothetical protein|nr:CPBP family intramembrane metalloprotease [Phycisphaerales bacterium]
MVQLLRVAKQTSRSRHRYTDLSRQPSYILAFLTPLIVYYEISLFVADKNIQIKAHDALVRFFELFDMPPTKGLFLGGVAIITILAIQHIMSRERWSIEPKVVAGMAIESVLLTFPLLAFGTMLAGVIAAASPTVLSDLGLSERIAVSIGAGLYEEFLFRMLLIAGVHTIACNLFKQSNLVGLTSGVIISAITFAAYHDFPNFGTLGATALFFYSIAGIYLGLIFVNRGFGIAAGTHAAYDIVATTLLASIAT